jgi:acetyl-CoA acetyltransferase
VHMTAVVLGVGVTPFAKQPQRSLAAVGAQAVVAALKDAELDRRQIQAAFCGNVQFGAGAGQSVLRALGMTGLPITNVENACASGGSAFQEALAWVEAGFVDVALAVGVEMLTHAGGGLIESSRPDVASQIGLPLPGLYALKASHYMAEYGATHEQLASVVVKSRRNAQSNEYAYFRTPVTIEEVLASPAISDPLTLFECCPNVDGAAAVVVASSEFARRHSVGTSIRVRGCALTSGLPVDRANSVADTTERAAALAYERAGIGPEDIDVCEVHEPFSIAEILHYEGLGLCAVGDGAAYVAEGRADVDGPGVAVNPSGGLLSRGHPLGASGIAQIAEIAWQLRGVAGARQRANAQVGVTHIMGGTIPELDGNACLVSVFST